MKLALKHPKTCRGCRAYEYAPGGVYGGVISRCSLYYPTSRAVPGQACPKPRTIKELIEAPKAP